jgi:hypothetical protein
MGGRLEHAIRLLPPVLSCSISKDDTVVVLIDASADPEKVRNAVERTLREAGVPGSVRVIGPPEPPAADRRSVSPLVATATVATVAAVGVGALVGGLAASDHQAALKRLPARAPSSRSAGATPTDSIDLIRRVEVSTAGPVIRVPAESPDRNQRVLPVSGGSAAEAISLTRAIPPVRGASAGESRHGSRSFGHPGHGRHGPPAWSHSISLGGGAHGGKAKGAR